MKLTTQNKPMIKKDAKVKTEQVAPGDIDEYIKGFPSAVQEILNTIRTTIKKAAPQAKEAISYRMPTFKLNGNLVHFAAFKNHIGFYPTPSGIAKFKKELSGYANAKGSVQFPLDQPVPYDLISRIVKYRVEETLKKQNKARTGIPANAGGGQ